MKRNSLLTIICLAVALWLPMLAIAQAQETVVVGQILTKADRIPLANVNICFKGSDKAVQSNEEGYFLIRTYEKYRTLTFSCVGFKQAQIHLRPGQSVGIEVTMEEMDNQLGEVFVLPGTNPALEMMRKIRVMRSVNDRTNLPEFTAKIEEQNLVLLNKMKMQFTGKRLYNQLKRGNISKNDTSLVVPLYMGQTQLLKRGKTQTEIAHSMFSSARPAEPLFEKMAGTVSSDLNFYNNSLTVFGKSMISPLAAIGGAFYDYYLADSLETATGKQYLIHFLTKNKKNLAFNGKMWVDSASLALVSIDAELPDQANINYIHNLKISQKFEQLGEKFWVPRWHSVALRMTYQMAADSLHPNPELLLKQTSDYSYSDSIKGMALGFAQSNYDTLTLNDRLKQLGNTPILKTAKWIADAALTGYMKFGKVDVGTIPQLARTTDKEGLRLTLPMRTNEDLWRNVSVGGYVGYGTKNNAISYSTMATVRIPGRKRHVLGVKYTDDLRRIDYNYNNYINTENPLNTGDEDMFTTIFSLWSADKLNHRKELQASFANEWTPDVESALYLRSNKLYSNHVLPMLTENGTTVRSLRVNSMTVTTRFSKDERTYEDHVQRIYISNNLPVLYLTAEAGHYMVEGKSGNYGKLIATMRHIRHFELGVLEYTAEAGLVLGKVPYTLLQYPAGTEAGGYGLNQMTPAPVTGSGGYSLASFNMMKYMEYGSDRFMELHGQFTTNGLLMNQIPVIKFLNLREAVSLKMAYGGLSSKHSSVLQYPDFMQGFNKPYMEVGVGLTNILRFLTIQSVWRLTDLDHPNVKPWGMRLGVSIGF